MAKRKITLDNGAKVESVAEFNDGNSHIIEDDHCYVLVNRDKDDRFAMSPWLFPEALRVLRKLPIPKPFLTEAVKSRLAEETTRNITKRLRK